MIWIALGMAALGLFLSAFFSGSETGFYRVTRMRLVLDAMGGDRTARGLLWLTNHPSMFIATALVGNNLANYLTSLAIVLGTQALTILRRREDIVRALAARGGTEMPNVAPYQQDAAFALL